MSSGVYKSSHNAEKQSLCVRTAMMEGGKAGALGLALGGVLVAGANSFFPAFRKSLGVSGKTALVVSPMFGLFFLETELEMNRCAQRRREVQAAAASLRETNSHTKSAL